MVLLIDFDSDSARLDTVRQRIPELERTGLCSRYVERARKPETRCSRSYEEIGQAIAQDCRDNSQTILNHALLQRSKGELERLRGSMRPVIFPSG